MRRSLSIIPTILFFAILGAPTISRADDITYDINQTVGTGTVVGTITTNGTLGVLTESDIVGGSVTITGLGLSYAAGLPSSIFVFSGDDLSATDESLIFNFSGTDDGGLAIAGKSSLNFYWNIGTAGFALGGDPADPGEDIYDGFTETNTPAESGAVAIGNVVTAPEPATSSLLLFAFAPLALMLVKRKYMPSL